MICPFCQSENIEGSDECANCGGALYGLDLPGAAQGSQAPAFLQDPISSLPIRPAVCVGPSDPVAFAVREMQRAESNCVLVMDRNDLAGIITGWDIVQKVAGLKEDLVAVTCGQVMTPKPLVLHEEDTIAVALNMMASGGFRHVPVVRGEEPVGFIVAGDLFRHVSPQLV